MPNAKLCWLCNTNPATTGEHILKKTTMDAKFSNIQWKNVHLHDSSGSTPVRVQGPGSKHNKYSFNLCESCNTKYTQPFDLSYQIFFEYLSNKYSKKVLHKRAKIPRRNIFKDKEKLQCENVFKYYLKSFGCELDSKNQPVPAEIIKALKGSAKIPRDFELYIFAGENPLALEKRSGPGGCLEITPPIAVLMRYKQPIRDKRLKKWNMWTFNININPLPLNANEASSY